MDPSPTQHGSIQFQAKPPRKNRCKKKRRGREDALSHLTAAKPAVPSVNASMVEAQESMLKAILRNGSNAVN
jgi:hypothetical protein